MYMEWRLGSLLRLLGWVAVVAIVLFFLAFTLGSSRSPDSAGAPRVNSAADARAFAFQIARTNGAGLNIRDCAALTCRRVGWAAEGATFLATCATPGPGGDTWLKGTSGGQAGFVARSYLSAAAGLNDLPDCAGGPAHPAAKG
jgi:hypothetical protein